MGPSLYQRTENREHQPLPPAQPPRKRCEFGWWASSLYQLICEKQRRQDTQTKNKDNARKQNNTTREENRRRRSRVNPPRCQLSDPPNRNNKQTTRQSKQETNTNME